MVGKDGFDAWSAGESYEIYMGRWSREIAVRFVRWLGAEPGQRWIEAGCGTGALTDAILEGGAPAHVLATDPSADFVAHLGRRLDDVRLETAVADALTLPAEDASLDVAVSGLMLNFVPDRAAALTEARRVLRPGGLLAFYVWDYPGGGIGFIDAFWAAAAALDPAAADLDEARRFPSCTAEALRALVEDSLGLEPEVTPIEIETVFPDFEAFWHPFTLGAGPAPGYCGALSEEGRATLKTELAQRFPKDGPISLVARAWAVKARMMAA